MKLIDLNPEWIGTGGHGITNSLTGLPVPYRAKIGISLNCPCGCGRPLFVSFTNPEDGLGKIHEKATTWERTGTTFEDLTLTPSILRADHNGCRWHGFITNGEVITVPRASVPDGLRG